MQLVVYERRKIPGGRVASSTLPRTVTNVCGNASSSTVSAARGSRARLRAFIDVLWQVSTTCSPSRANHTGTTSGEPSARTVASLAVRPSWARKASASARLMSRMDRGAGI